MTKTAKKQPAIRTKLKSLKVKILKHSLQKILEESIIVINYLPSIHRTSGLRLEELV